MTDSYFLSRGRHNTGEHGRCAMEWTSYIAGEPHTDRPQCVSPLLQSFCISLNDSLDDQERQKLRPYLARCIGTAGDGLDTKRAWMCTDLLIREFAPAWLDAAGLGAYAAELRSLEPVVSKAAARKGKRLLVTARRAVGPRWSTDNVQRAAFNQTSSLALAGEWAGVFARGANLAASQTVARGAGQATGSRRLLVLASLQQSLFTLLDRMLPTVPVELPADRQQIALELAG